MQASPTHINQTKVDVALPTQSSPPLIDFAFLHYLRIAFYLFIIIKLIQIVYLRRKKLKISERIQRKFLFSHGVDMIKRFSAQQTQLMNLTLQNTLKNAIQQFHGITKRSSLKKRKSVSFIQQSNQYFDHPQNKQVLSFEETDSGKDKCALPIYKNIQQQIPLLEVQQKQIENLGL